MPVEKNVKARFLNLKKLDRRIVEQYTRQTRLYDRMTKRLASRVEKPGARQPDAMKPSFISDKQMT